MSASTSQQHPDDPPFSPSAESDGTAPPAYSSGSPHTSHATPAPTASTSEKIVTHSAPSQQPPATGPYAEAR